jgi:hypothetical protein
MAEAPTPAPTSSTVSASQPYHAGGTPPKKRGNGSGWVLALAVLQTIGAIIIFLVASSAGAEGAVATFVFMGLLAVVFFGLWVWARSSPFPALLTALIVFLTVHIADAVIDPSMLLRGILVKIFIISGLCAGIKKAYQIRRMAELEAASADTASNA